MAADDATRSNEVPEPRKGLSRREFLTTGAIASAAVLGGGSGALAQPAGAFLQVSERGGTGEGDLVLVNGKIHTMDAAGSVVSSLAIQGGRFVSVGRGAKGRDAGARVIDLRGRTVVPGIIDNHNHIVLMGNRPGHHTPLENANSIAAVQETLANRAAGVEAGEFITTIGGFHINQFSERRFPTLTELDDSVPDHPVYVSQSFSGPSATNSAGKAFFESHGVTVGADGSIANGVETGKATLALRQTLLTPETRRRGALEAMAYGASLGVTTHLDEGAFQATGDPSQDGAASEDNFSMHLPFLELYREEALGTRLRINFLHADLSTDLPTLTERLKNAFPFFGGEMVKTIGIGEFTAGSPFELFFGSPSEAWRAGTRLVAERGWRNENHSLTRDDFAKIIAGWEEVNEEVDITGLRWVLAHVPFITPEWVDRLKALGGGLSLTSWRYLAGTSSNNGPPFRMIVDNGINVGMSSDGMQIAPMNPWIHMFYATTGVNAAGDLINDGQQITREEVLKLYTADNGWFLGEEDDLGTIEEGKLGDLVVLSDDYFTVPDERLRDISSVLSVVGGRIVHDRGVLR